MFNKNHIFDKYEKNIHETSIEAINSSRNLTSISKERKMMAMQINFVNQYCFINIGQILTRAIQKFEQYNITSGNTKFDAPQGTNRRI